MSDPWPLPSTSQGNNHGDHYYIASARFHPDKGLLFVRTRGRASDQAEAVGRALRRAMPGSSYVTTVPLAEIIGPKTRSWELGARMFAAFGLMLGQGLRLSGAGVAIGAAAALWAGKFVKPLLFDVSPRDPHVFALVAASLLVAAIIATLIPAVRASRVDTVQALRSD